MKRKSSPTIVDDKRDVELIWDSLEKKQGYIDHRAGDGGYTVKEWARRMKISQGSASAFLKGEREAGVLDMFSTIEDGRKSNVYYPKGYRPK